MSILIKRPDIPNDISFFNIDDGNYKIGETITKIDLNGIVHPIKSGVNTDDATATELDLLFGKTAYAKGVKITGKIPIVETTEYSIPILSTNDFTIPKGYYEKDIIIRPEYNNAATVTDFREEGFLGSLVHISAPSSVSQTNGSATVSITSTTNNDNWASRCAGACFSNKIPGKYKYIDVTFRCWGDGAAGLSIYTSIPSSATNPQTFSDVYYGRTETKRLNIPTSGGYLYFGSHSTNIGYNSTRTANISISKCILYTS